MQTCTKELTKEQWDNNTAVARDGSRYLKKYSGVFSEAQVMGYGIYGTECYEKDGKYICKYKTGSSCD